MEASADRLGSPNCSSMSVQDHSARVTALLQSLHAKDQGHWRDDSFTHLLPDSHHTYLPIGDMLGPQRGAMTLLEQVNEHDVVQSTGTGLGDCWFVTAAMLLAQTPARVKALFMPECDPSVGFYAVRVFSNGEWRVLWLDDRIPCSHGQPSYAHSRTLTETWVWLLEKALAKFYGSYDALAGGNIGEGLMDLTGAGHSCWD